MHSASTSLGIPTIARVVHENAPDDLRTECEKVHAAFAADAPCAHQFEVSLVSQGGRLQGLARRTTSQVPPSNSPQLGVNERHQAVERLFISSAPGGDQPANIPW